MWLKFRKGGVFDRKGGFSTENLFRKGGFSAEKGGFSTENPLRKPPFSDFSDDFEGVIENAQVAPRRTPAT